MYGHRYFKITLAAISIFVSCTRHNDNPNPPAPPPPATAPKITTTAATAVSNTTANTGGNITDHGNATITSSGLYFDTIANSTKPAVFLNAQGLDNFTIQMQGLFPATTYYYRAFAVNAADSAYGSLLQFTTTYTPSQYQVSTLAGTGAYGLANGPALQAGFYHLSGIAIDLAGNIFVSEFSTNNNTVILSSDIRKIALDGTVSTLANFTNPAEDIVIDSAGNIFVATADWKILKVTPAGTVSIFAGSGQGTADGTGTSASFYYPVSLDMDSKGNLFVADSKSIRKVTPAAVVTTLPSFSLPKYYDVAVDKAGNVYASDQNSIAELDTLGHLTVIAGSSTPGNLDGQGSAASFNLINQMRFDKTGNMVVADYMNNKIRLVTPTGLVSTLAGSGKQGAGDGDAALATFHGPISILPDTAGNIYVLDQLNNKVRKIAHK
jgi:hypothetical protein